MLHSLTCFAALGGCLCRFLSLPAAEQAAALKGRACDFGAKGSTRACRMPQHAFVQSGGEWQTLGIASVLDPAFPGGTR